MHQGRHVDRALELLRPRERPRRTRRGRKQHPDVVERLLKLDRERRAAAAAPTASGERPRRSPALRRWRTAEAPHGMVTSWAAVRQARGQTHRDRRCPARARGLESLGGRLHRSRARRVGLEISADPPDAEVTWKLRLRREAIWRRDVHGGALGLIRAPLGHGREGRVGATGRLGGRLALARRAPRFRFVRGPRPAARELQLGATTRPSKKPWG